MKNYKIEELRAIALLMVLCAHFSLTNDIISFGGGKIFPFYLGADLFFVISGYFAGLKIMQNSFKPFAYCRKRVCKLYPPVCLLILLTGLLELCCNQLSVIDPVLYCDMDTYVRESVYTLLGNLKWEYTCYAYGQFWYFRTLLWLYLGSACLGWVLSYIKINRMKILKLIMSLLLSICLIVRVSILCGNSYVGNVMEIILNYKMDFYFGGILCATLHEKKRKVNMMYVYLLIPFIIGIYSCGGLWGIYENKFLTGIIYPIALLFYMLALLVARDNGEMRVRAWIEYVASRSYYMYVFNFFALVVAWLIIYNICPDIFYINPIWYGIVQICVGSVVLLFLSEYSFNRFEKRNF